MLKKKKGFLQHPNQNENMKITLAETLLKQTTLAETHEKHSSQLREPISNWND